MKSSQRVLIIDDEISIRETLKMFLQEKGLKVLEAGSGREAYRKFLDKRPPLVILDIRLPDISGLELLKKIVAQGNDTKVIMITAYHDMETTIEAMRHGAFDYIHKPLDVDKLDEAINQSIMISNSSMIRNTESGIEQESPDRHRIVGKTPVIQSLFKTIGLMSRHRETVLIEGETGSGKELIAHVIHESSPDRNKPFVTVDCTTIVDSLFESELFGHEKGAFTGAGRIKRGRVELAQGGTIFFDEVGDLNPPLQAKLLRFLESREFTRLGSNQTLHSNSRIIAATNRKLDRLVEVGQFRHDLLFRLNVMHIHVPPLRERLDDIPELINYFLSKINKDLGTNVSRIEEKALSVMCAHSWPGNVRELKNVLIKTVMGSRGSVIRCESVESVLGNRSINQPSHFGRGRLDEIQKHFIIQTIEETRWNLSEAARRLGVSRPTLRKRLKSYGVTRKIY
ncbi:MAG: sigma-54 dependent transcriptional regulator [Syntrophaceae bacterium]|nr:sigma-54 dependent transcriptional regulator [Syntrophaceae bacterium]